MVVADSFFPRLLLLLLLALTPLAVSAAAAAASAAVGGTGNAADLKVSIAPSEVLPNGTKFVLRHKNVSFHCSSLSQQKSLMSWSFVRPESKPEEFTEIVESFTEFSLANMVHSLQGNYTCSANNTAQGIEASTTVEVLVYYPPTGFPVCHSEFSDTNMYLYCSWVGGYPYPTLVWSGEGVNDENEDAEHFLPGRNDTKILTLSKSATYDGKMFKCTGSHFAYTSRVEPSCTTTLKAPLPESEPLVTGSVEKNKTLICRVKEGNPPPKLSWLRNSDTEIRPSNKYVISNDGQVSYLTIINCSKELDEGTYFCKSENPLGTKEVEIWVSVNSKNISGLVAGITVVLLLSGAIFFGLYVYFNRTRLFTRSHFWKEDSSNVFTLVESDGEDDFLPESSSGVTSVVNPEIHQGMNGHTVAQVYLND
ncbi:V-set and immunoglobulin domain-containing protein 10 [Callorhinchus milii]|uniref:V-set and immunoglobulin domain-containing protein 10 n=1 Tax=Callorhinchus milii TaxID=7868 RepID=UPI0003D8AB41|nr:V-set and immunoglobulin domain-containing protein 10 [Callorhinchus milii]